MTGFSLECRECDSADIVLEEPVWVRYAISPRDRDGAWDYGRELETSSDDAPGDGERFTCAECGNNSTDLPEVARLLDDGRRVRWGDEWYYADDYDNKVPRAED